jgi:hypothetical protein
VATWWRRVTIGEHFNGVRYGVVVDQCGLVTAPFLNVQIEGVVTRIQFAADEPTVERLVAVVEDPFPLLYQWIASAASPQKTAGFLND